jgi:hypothetical protein
MNTASKPGASLSADELLDQLRRELKKAELQTEDLKGVAAKFATIIGKGPGTVGPNRKIRSPRDIDDHNAEFLRTIGAFLETSGKITKLSGELSLILAEQDPCQQ